MESPEVSIIVPVYNTEKYISRCINSILAQTFTNFECILIDDGSTDNSFAICENYGKSDNRFIVIHQQNSGASTARNNGLDKAKGKYICFVDSDDYIEKNMLEKLVVAIEKAKTEVACCGYYEDTKVRKLCDEDFIFSNCSAIEIIHYLEMRQAFGIVVNKIYMKTIIDKHNLRFSASIKFGEDMLFSLQYFRHVQSAYISSDFLYYYLHENPNSVTKSKVTFDEMNFRFENVTNLFKELDNNDQSIFYAELLAKDFIYTIALLLRLYTENKEVEARHRVIKKLNSFYKNNRAKNKFRTKFVAVIYTVLVHTPSKLFGVIFFLFFLIYIILVKISLANSRFVKS